MILRSTESSVCREGVSLLEVIVSVTIFLFSISALAQLINTSSQQATRVEKESLAMQICQSRMNEVAAGIIALTPAYDQALQEGLDVPEGYRDWQWSINATEMFDETGSEGLWRVEITVSWAENRSVKLCQYLLDPEAKGTTADAANIEGDDDESDLPEDDMSGTGNAGTNTGN